ncbi:hypothetical protein OESDEN_19484 [Oesophagostomum dentatum]|uniref:Uncharacterized protein n=1 Tax=Oesophagostomum dentatum TaxID=61180 RepID=A0A0B1SAA9_OESDE|nr:hypothetical protein OESDEN_19484 [Oesophagostomum dentatum]
MLTLSAICCKKAQILMSLELFRSMVKRFWVHQHFGPRLPLGNLRWFDFLSKKQEQTSIRLPILVAHLLEEPAMMDIWKLV